MRSYFENLYYFQSDCEEAEYTDMDLLLQDISKAIEDLPQEFVKRLLLRVLVVQDEAPDFELLRPRYSDRQDYHEHDKTTPKCS